MLNLTRGNEQPFFVQLFSMKDPRTKDWITLKDPTFIIVTVLAYLYTAKVLGPKFMKDREPYNLNKLIQWYNVFQVLANIYFCTRLAYLAYGKLGYSPFCQGLNYSDDGDSIELLNTLFYYLIVRVIDFADTLFFILKKKFTHITQLHVIHHTIVVVSGWQFMQFGADGQPILGVCLNSSIHVIMYSYYLLASLGPQVKKYLWWKKYLTAIQIVQFLIMIAHGSVPLFIDCGYPSILLSLALPQVFLILGFFVNFYVRSYIVERNDSAKKRAKTANLPTAKKTQ